MYFLSFQNKEENISTLIPSAPRINKEEREREKKSFLLPPFQYYLLFSVFIFEHTIISIIMNKNSSLLNVGCVLPRSLASGWLFLWRNMQGEGKFLIIQLFKVYASQAKHHNFLSLTPFLPFIHSFIRRMSQSHFFLSRILAKHRVRIQKKFPK